LSSSAATASFQIGTSCVLLSLAFHVDLTLLFLVLHIYFRPRLVSREPESFRVMEVSPLQVVKVSLRRRPMSWLGPTTPLLPFMATVETRLEMVMPLELRMVS
jgi:hypothetical protein